MSGACPTSPYPSSIKVSSITRNLTTSAMSGKRYSRNYGVQLWQLDVTYPPMTRAQFDPIYAFIVSQNGTYGTFTFSAHDKTSPRGSVSGSPSGTPKIKGASQTGTSITTDGWPHSATGLLLAGDYITISGDNKVYMVTASVDSDGSGNATMTIFPQLRSSPSDNADITSSSVAFTVSMLSEIQESQVGEALIYSYSFSMLEAL